MTTRLKMINEFQCPGCTAGSGTEGCRALKVENRDGAACDGHVPGTFRLGGPLWSLGLPKGFNQVGARYVRRHDGPDEPRGGRSYIRLWPNGETPSFWNTYNVPVWAMVKDGYLFVRTYSPRTNFGYVDVVQGGTLDMVPNAVNIEPFLDDMD